jgi:hypothetical protein
LDGAIGNDWAIFSVYPNSNTGLLPVEAQWAVRADPFFRVNIPPNYDPQTPWTWWTAAVIGFGVDRHALNHVQQKATGEYRGYDQAALGLVNYVLTRTAPGNSGGPMSYNDHDVAFAVLAHGCNSSFGIPCYDPNTGKCYVIGTSMANSPLRDAIDQYPSVDGERIWYVDGGHPFPFGQNWGSLTTPFWSLNDAAAAAAPGDRILITSSESYQSVYIDKELTLEAPVGPVTIIGR